MKIINKILKITLAILVIGAKYIHGAEPIEKGPTARHFISICGLFTNETKYLKEWIEYHRLVGVDHFYLYSNESKDRPSKILSEYINKGIVTLIDWSDNIGFFFKQNWPDHLMQNVDEKVLKWALSVQIPAYQNAVLLFGKKTEWMVFLDVDEFLTPVSDMKLLSIIQKYKKFAAIKIPSQHFDASYIKQLSKRKLIIEATDLIGEPSRILEKTVDKTLFRPSECTHYTWPPFSCVFKNDQQALLISANELCINHYVNRDTNQIISTRKMFVDNRFLSEKEMHEILKEGYEIADQKKTIYRYIPELYKKLGYP